MVTNILAATETWYNVQLMSQVYSGHKDLSAAGTGPSPKILLLLEGTGGEVWELMFWECGKLLLKSWELNFYLSGPRYCWYFPLVCQACCYLRDQIRSFLFVHIDLLYHRKTHGTIFKAVSLKLAPLAAQISRVHGRGTEWFVLRQLSSPSVKSSSVSKNELFWTSVLG